ncbi:MAG: tRNA (adenosine(37)-N6)-dimethylallyltransferase MiaA [Candidatus Peribacteraceae bacterium]|nr:tRNA (adenosine(37)-N6)-dimethylallyltransferase MiaA [Candidatus Peribacteraceae bacterium]
MIAQIQHDWQSITRNFLQTAAKPLIVVLGPTASGKTGFSIQLAHFLQSDAHTSAEIINADSRQLYKYLDIGTAKITQEEMENIPHHLFSVLDPKQPVTIGWYQREATAFIDQIQQRKHVPMLVGGSMLYISAIIDGLVPVEKSAPTIRSRLEAEYMIDGGVTLWKKLEAIDPQSAASIPHQNKHYLIRALEMHELTGKTKSQLSNQSVCPYDVLIFGIHRERSALVHRINQRTKLMIENGWIKEVQSLIDRGYSIDDPAMESSGYREIAEFVVSKGKKEDLIERISAKTRQYAKRQTTWWRNDGRIVWIDGKS